MLVHPSITRWDRHGRLIYVIDSYPNDGSCGFMQATTNDTTRVGFFPATAMPDADWWQALWPQPQQVLGALGIRPDMKVVDLCCGDCLFTAPLALLVRHVIAIDIDPNMMAVTRTKIAARGAVEGLVAEPAAAHCAIATIALRSHAVMLMKSLHFAARRLRQYRHRLTFVFMDATA
jgi:SAM-dependent methyltransferase